MRVWNHLPTPGDLTFTISNNSSGQMRAVKSEDGTVLSERC